MTQTATPLRIPESMGPAEIGPYMRSVREHFTFTPQDVSERLHIRVRYVNAIEEGKFELMPGKVYARGYIHTYAEFLGLDADQVVAQCFEPVADQTPVANVAKPAAPLPSMISAAALPKRSGKRGLWLPAFGVIVALVIYTQWTTDEETVVAPVVGEKVAVPVAPETLLPSQGDTVMPTAENFECLTTADAYLTCFFSQRVMGEMEHMDRDTARDLVPNPLGSPAFMNLGDTTELERDE